MARKLLGLASVDPKRTNIFIDSCAFDPKYAPEDAAANRLFELYDAGEINLVVSHSNMKELEHPNVPRAVKQAAKTKIFSLEVNLTDEELARKQQILDLLVGNGRREKMRQDAEHVFEAQKYGRFFVTTDKGILKRESELNRLCGVVVLLPSEMLSRIEAHASQ